MFGIIFLLFVNHILANSNGNYGSWSMFVSIYSDDNHQGNVERHYCSGTILSESLILTSVRCVESIDVSMGKMKIDVHDGTSRIVDRVFIHPNWTKNSDGMINDVAILHVNQPVDLTKNQGIVSTRLQSPRDAMEFTRDITLLTVLGWDQSSLTRKLRRATVSPRQSDHLICEKSIKDWEKQFCAGLTSDHQSEFSQ